MSTLTIFINKRFYIGTMLLLSCGHIANKSSQRIDSIEKNDSVMYYDSTAKKNYRSLKRNEDSIRLEAIDSVKLKTLKLQLLKKGINGIRLCITRSAFPWLSEQLMYISILPTDSECYFYKYKLPQPEGSDNYMFKRIKIKPKISYKAILDSITYYNIVSLPNQQDLNLKENILDGERYSIQIANRLQYKKLFYSNPDAYNDTINKKISSFFRFIDKTVVRFLNE